MIRFIALAFGSAFSFFVVMAGFWLYFTWTIEKPYHEVWIGLNSHAPTTLREWSCRTVKARMTRPGLPPMSCEGLW